MYEDMRPVLCVCIHVFHPLISVSICYFCSVEEIHVYIKHTIKFSHQNWHKSENKSNTNTGICVSPPIAEKQGHHTVLESCDPPFPHRLKAFLEYFWLVCVIFSRALCFHTYAQSPTKTGICSRMQLQ